jgi:hypothetical protein
MDQIVAQALTTYGKIAGMKRMAATAKTHSNGNGNGHKPDLSSLEVPANAVTAANR